MKNKIIGKLAYLFIAWATISLLTTSCKDYLNVEPSSLRTGSNFITNDDNAVMAVNAIYNSLASHERWYNGSLESSSYYIGEILTDHSEMGSVKGVFDDLERMIELRPQTDEVILNGIWWRSYDGIYRADYVLENLPSAPVSDQLKNRLLGETYFLKGMNILRLVQTFGNIPIGTGITDRKSTRLNSSH